jgi:hypothetical protein
MRLSPATIILAIPLLAGCRTDKQEEAEPEEDTAAWWEEPVDDLPETDTAEADSGDNGDDDDKPDNDDDDKPDDDEIEDCPEDFDPTQACEGDWTTTLCTEEGMLWWCEDGVWLNEDSKP